MNRDHLYLIKERIDNLHEDDRFAFGCFLIAKGVMRAPWYFRAGKSIIKWRLKCTDIEAWVYLLEHVDKKVPTMIDNLLDQMINHMLWGIDLSGGNAIGGFNDEELTQITNFLRIIDEHSVFTV